MAEHGRNRGTSADPARDYEKVKLLFDYTKYHISVYTTLGTILMGVLGLHNNITLTFCAPLLWVSIGFIAVAGLAGGIIASTLPEKDSLNEFFCQRTGFWGVHVLSGRTWTRIEHTAFWAGLIAGLISFATPQLLSRFDFCTSHAPTATSKLPVTSK
jgi:hypothetical protein